MIEKTHGRAMLNLMTKIVQQIRGAGSLLGSLGSAYTPYTPEDTVSSAWREVGTCFNLAIGQISDGTKKARPKKSA